MAMGGQFVADFELFGSTVWACDFLQLYDIWFRPIFAFFIMNVNTKEVVHWAVTRTPTEQWTAQQLREATPFGAGPQVLIRGGDKKHGPDFDRVAEDAGIVPVMERTQARKSHDASSDRRFVFVTTADRCRLTR